MFYNTPFERIYIMNTKVKEQIKNAIQWIDSLPNYKQAPFGSRGRLGDDDTGYCCLGAGCAELGISYCLSVGDSQEFAEAVGLKTALGVFLRGDLEGDTIPFKQVISHHERTSLTQLNDHTEIGFEGIADFMKKNPYSMFRKEVADILEKHYSEEKLCSPTS